MPDQNCISNILSKIYQIPCRIICVLVLLLQSSLLDYYLVRYNEHNRLWWLFSILDLIVVSIFIAAFIISYRHLKTTPGVNNDHADGMVATSEEEKVGGELPLGYIAWLVYSSGLAAKIGLLFGTELHIAQTLTDETMFGPSLLRTTLSLTSVVFFLLIVTHHSAPSKSDRQAFMEAISSSVTIDLLDATQFLDVIYVSQSHVLLTYGLHDAIIAIACINMLLPTILLVALSRSRFGYSPVWLKRLRFLHRVIYFLLVNLPMLVIRLVVWHVHKKEASVFIIKNVIGVGSVVREVYGNLIEIHASEPRPVQPAAPEMVELQAMKRDEQVA